LLDPSDELWAGGSADVRLRREEEMSAGADSVVVVGGGVIGLTCAYFLAKEGRQVTVLEKRAATMPNCSTGNAGMVVPSHFIPLAAPGVIGQGLRWMLKPESPFSLRPQANRSLWRWAWQFYRACAPARVEAAKLVLRDLSLTSREWFVRLRDRDGLSFGLEERGLLALCKTSEMLRHEAGMVAEGKALGIRAEVLDSRGVAELDPGIEMDIAGAVYFPQDCHLNPAVFRQELIRGLGEMGATISWCTDVTGIERDGDRLVAVRSGDREWRADAFVIAGGVWSDALSKHLGVRLPMQPGKGYSMTLTKPPQLPKICSLLMEARVAVTPMGETLRVGGTMEIGGREGVVNAGKLRGIVKSMPKYFPQFGVGDFAEQAVWTGLRPCTPDGLPYIGWCPGLTNTCVAAGHAMLGLSLAPVTGRVVSQLVTGVKPDADMGLLVPGRYR
jgi:D-amino-acid dehydrogenase